MVHLQHTEYVSDGVKPTKFKSINDEDSIDTNGTMPKKYRAKDNRLTDQQKPNFLLEYSFPAVTFDRVCYYVDKSQQQSRFIFNDCMNYLTSLISTRDQLLEQRVEILKSVNLNVPYGSIFGLLGPSSCGKTTLLRCLVGLLKPSSGSIKLFGHEIPTNQRDRGRESTECQVPGQSIGYMPQDLGLYEDFTIEQLLTTFGQYMKMDTQLIKERINFMTEFLDLPEKKREICSLSGGQKRRVSFAIACLHMPPLIILDEPTVGVDPLLRKSIWKYLRKLASEENKTIIITTHYIEEAAQADQVALMRAGEILVQDRPANIMLDNNCKTLEQAFLQICNNVTPDGSSYISTKSPSMKTENKQLPMPKFVYFDEDENPNVLSQIPPGGKSNSRPPKPSRGEIREARYRDNPASIEGTSERKLDHSNRYRSISVISKSIENTTNTLHDLSLSTEGIESGGDRFVGHQYGNHDLGSKQNKLSEINEPYRNSKSMTTRKRRKKVMRILKRDKFVLDNSFHDRKDRVNSDYIVKNNPMTLEKPKQMFTELKSSLMIMWALLYKGYLRNVNSIPLVAFQFLLPLVQMISFSLCVGGRPTNIGLGLVNFDQPSLASSLVTTSLPISNKIDNISTTGLPRSLRLAPNLDKEIRPSPNDDSENYTLSDEATDIEEQSLSLEYLSYIDKSMISIYEYDNLQQALEDVRQVKLWAVMEIGENFTETIAQRFDPESFYDLDSETTRQSIIKLYPDRSNKILDMICQRSLFDSYRKFLVNHFKHFKRLPIEVKEPIFDIKPNIISNSIDGYTESIAPGLLASLTYIMAAGLTTFIMVVERSDGILERTYTSGINPVTYLLAHAVFRSIVMMLQIGVVLFLTFYILKQPLVGSIMLCYAMLMTLNMTGISYGLLISSLVIDQNGAALTIVGSLVVKITLSGILWPFEAIPRWLRVICYIQPLTMPVQALKAITLKGATLYDRSVYLGFVVAISWMALFLVISAKRFKFYQH